MDGRISSRVVEPPGPLVDDVEKERPASLEIASWPLPPKMPDGLFGSTRGIAGDSGARSCATASQGSASNETATKADEQSERIEFIEVLLRAAPLCTLHATASPIVVARTA